MIEAEHITKKYGEKEVLKDISFTVNRGEIFGIIGPSGAGKSTLLRILDLIEEPTSGSLRVFGEVAIETEKKRLKLRRRMAMLFQKPVLFNGSVHENIATGLRYREESSSEIDRKVSKALEEVGLREYSSRRAKTLSGGEAQRVAFARALVLEPEILMLDEPTANLDPRSTEKIEKLIERINRELKMTVVISTHDLLQGLRLSHRMAVLIKGEISQVGAAHDIFYVPKKRSVAEYVGVENLLEGVVLSSEDGVTRVDVSGTTFTAISSFKKGERVCLSFRAEDVVLALDEARKISLRNMLQGSVQRLIPHGPLVYVKVDCGVELTALLTRNAAIELDLAPGKEVYAGVKATSIHVIPGRD